MLADPNFISMNRRVPPPDKDDPNWVDPTTRLELHTETNEWYRNPQWAANELARQFMHKDIYVMFNVFGLEYGNKNQYVRYELDYVL